MRITKEDVQGNTHTNKFNESLKERKESLDFAIYSTFFKPKPITDKGIKEFLTRDNTIQNVNVKVIGGCFTADFDLIRFRVMDEVVPDFKNRGMVTVEIISQKDFRRYSGGLEMLGDRSFVIHPNSKHPIKVEDQEDFKLNVI